MEARRQPPRIEKIRLDTLRVPPAGKAERPFREAKGDRIAAEFDINSFGFPVVCRVNGTNWVVDGQHRAYAIQKCGYAKASDTIECEVYEGLSMAEMARMFLGRNRSTGNGKQKRDPYGHVKRDPRGWRVNTSILLRRSEAGHGSPTAGNPPSPPPPIRTASRRFRPDAGDPWPPVRRRGRPGRPRPGRAARPIAAA